MPLTTGITSGAYTATWNALAVGQVRPGGYKKRYGYESKPIFFDSVGMNAVDMLFGGIHMFVDFVCMDYNAAAINKLRWPFHNLVGTSPVSGYSIWEAAKPFVMTSCRADINPQTITFYKTYLAPNFDIELDYSGTTERILPMRLIVLPRQYVSGAGATVLPSGCSDIEYFIETLVA